MIKLLACRLGRNDETPNIELAEKLCASADKTGVSEIADGLKSKEQAVANDCVKVLYEVGQRNRLRLADSPTRLSPNRNPHHALLNLLMLKYLHFKSLNFRGIPARHYHAYNHHTERYPQSKA